MSIVFKSSTDFKTNKIISFNLDEEHLDGDARKIYDSLEFDSELQFGKLYRQRDSEDYWFVDTERNFAYIVLPDRVDLIKEWNSNNLLPDNELWEKLQSIGGTPPHLWTMSQDYIDFPCQTMDLNGKWTDFCIIRFTKVPPFETYFKNIKLLKDIQDVKPSEYAMPHKLRVSSTLTDEIRMSFSPFTVKTKSGKRITYNGITNFTSTGEIRADEIEKEIEFSYDHFKKIQDTPFDQKTFVIGKWDSRLAKMLNDLKEERKKTAPNNSYKQAGDSAKSKTSILNKIWSWLTGN